MHPIKLDIDSLVVDTFATAHEDGADTTVQAAMAAVMITASCGETLCEIPCPAN